MFPTLHSLLHAVRRSLGLAGPVPVRLDDDEWVALQQEVPFIRILSPPEATLLRERIGEFLARKTFVGIGLDLAPWQQQLIAAYACLPILHLGIASYRNWKTLVVYPDTFAPTQEWVDEAGVAHSAVVPQAGEAWERGPVVLSWADVCTDGAVIVHEMTHTLDAANGEVNGFPPLPEDLPPQDWTAVFSAAYARLCREVERDEEPTLDPYAATDPAEFLAVACEYFFFAPAHLRAEMPAVYRHLAHYFRQEPHRYGDEIPAQRPGAGA